VTRPEHLEYLLRRFEGVEALACISFLLRVFRLSPCDLYCTELLADIFAMDYLKLTCKRVGMRALVEPAGRDEGRERRSGNTGGCLYWRAHIGDQL
jgi:hypothetical protein